MQKTKALTGMLQRLYSKKVIIPSIRDTMSTVPVPIIWFGPETLTGKVERKGTMTREEFF